MSHMERAEESGREDATGTKMHKSERTQSKIERSGVAFLLQQMRQNQRQESTATPALKPTPMKQEKVQAALLTLGEEKSGGNPSAAHAVVSKREHRKIHIAYNFERLSGGAVALEPLQTIRDCFFSNTTPAFGFSPHYSENNYVRSCKWSSDGCWLATDSEDRFCRIFSFDRDQQRLNCHSEVRNGGLVLDWQWCPNTSLFASTTRNQPVHLRNPSGKCQYSYRVVNPSTEELVTAHSISFSNNGQKLYAGYYKGVSVFEIERQSRQTRNFRIFARNESTSGSSQRAIVSCLAACPTFDGVYAAGSFGGGVALFSEQTGQCDTLIGTGSPGVTQLAYSSDGGRLYAGYRKSSFIECFDLRKLSLSLQRFHRPCSTNQRVHFQLDSNNRFLFSGSTDGDVLIHDLAKSDTAGTTRLDENAPTWTITASTSAVTGLSLHSELPLLAVSTGQRIFPLPLASSPYSSSSDDDSPKTSPTEHKNNPYLDNSVKLWRI